MSIRDETGDERILRQLFPEQVGVPWQGRRAAVAQVCRQRGASPHSLDDGFRARRRVTQGNANARCHEVLDEIQRPGHLGRERHETNHPACRVLAPGEVVLRGRRHRGCIMRAPRTVVRRDVGPFHVQAQNPGRAAREHGPGARGESGAV